MVERTGRTVARHRMFEDGPSASIVVVAVSGGPDSICLLDVLARLRSTFGLTLHVAHVDHGLSEESERVAAEVARHAAAAGFEVHLMRAPDDLAGPNLQARARELRYRFLGAIATKLGGPAPPSSIATGHTLDDRVETTLARLIHGSGTDGLAGLRPAGHPLIASRRAETRAYCEERELPFFDDPANEDVSFERVAVRKSVVAAIEERWGDGAVRAIARSAERLAEDADALQDSAFGFFEGNVDADQDGSYRYDLEVFLGLSRALRRRVLALTVGRVRDRLAGIDEVLDSLDRYDRKDTKRFSLAGGVEIILDRSNLWITIPPSALSRE